MKIKKILSLLLTAVLCLTLFGGCTGGQTAGTLEGAHVFVFKNTGNAFGTLMFEGFSQVCEAAGKTAVYKTPAEPTVAEQVEMLDTLITQKVASITVSPCSDTGFEEVFRRAEAAGIKIVSVDNMASPDSRVTHTEQCDTQTIGRTLIHAAVLIALHQDYPEDGDLERAMTEALAGYTGPEIRFGVLTASVDTPIQNLWISYMQEELLRDIYQGKVSSTLDIKYGNDEPAESTTQANAFVAENAVDVIISPTTIGMAAAGQVLKASGSSIHLTGLGLPHEMQSFMPALPTDDAFDFVCPYMMLWDVRHLGAVAGAATLAACDGTFDGTPGTSFELDGKTYTALEASDGGSRVVAVDPYVFHKGNMADWVNVL